MNTRFGLGYNDNTIGPVFNGATVTPSILNGVGLHAPAVEQDSSYPMANLLSSDRYLPWKTSNSPPSGNNALKVDIDLGAQRTLRYIGIHGISCLSALEGIARKPLLVRAEYQVSSYDGTGSFTTFGSDATFGGLRDTVIDNLADATFRYLRIKFSDAVSAPFSIGRLFVGNPSVDMGRIYSASEDAYVHGALRSSNLAMGPTTTYVGEDHRELSMTFSLLGDTQIALLDKIRKTHQPFFYFPFTSGSAAQGEILECILRDLRVGKNHLWNPPNIYSAQLDLLQLA